MNLSYLRLHVNLHLHIFHYNPKNSRTAGASSVQNRAMKTGLVALTTLAVAAALVGFTPTTNAVKLEFKFKDGDKLTAKSVAETSMVISGAFETEGMTKTTASQVTEFKAGEDGWFKFTTSTTESKTETDLAIMDMGDMDQLAQEMKIMGEMNSAGKVRNFVVEGDPQITSTIETQPLSKMGYMGLTFPDKELNVGDSWKTEVKHEAGEAGGMITPKSGNTVIEYTLDKMEMMDGKNMAVITFTIKTEMEIIGPVGDGSLAIDGKGTIHFDVEAGHPVKIEQTADNTVDLGQAIVDQSLKSTTTISK